MRRGTGTEHAAPEVERAAHPPETLEGWYVLHQVFELDASPLHRTGSPLAEMRESAVGVLHDITHPANGGWSAVVPLIGSASEVMLMHFRTAIDELGAVRRRLAREPLFDALRPRYTFLSVTEAALYHLTADLVSKAESRGGFAGDEQYRRELEERAAAELASDGVRRRLYPQQPASMPYVCFYPMSKRRDHGQNWYALSIEERSRLMYAHGMTGRRYAGRVQQVITGAIGLDSWEWGVTLFAADPLVFKRLLTDMRFDEGSARYAEFGEFFVGKVADPAAWVASLG